MQRQIAINEYMKSIYHNKWAMDEKHILDTYNRLGIPMAEGYTLEGSGNSDIMIVPTDTVVKYTTKFKNKKTAVDRMMEAIFGDTKDVGTMVKFDGTTLSGTRWFQRIGSVIGTPDVRVLKTVIRSRSKDGEDYLGMKHLQSSIEEGMEFYKPGEAEPFARVVADKDSGLTYIVEVKDGKEGKAFDHIATPNEAKIMGGKFGEKNLYQLNTLSDKDFKVLKNPIQSKLTAAHPVTLGEIILDNNLLAESPEANELLKQILKHYGKVSDEYMSALLEMRKNPKAFIAAVERHIEENEVPNEGDEYLAMLKGQGGKGAGHKTVTGLFSSFINNSYVKNGLLKGRRLAKGKATQLYLKPSMYLPIEDGVEMMASADNTVMVNQSLIAMAKDSWDG